MDSPNYILDEQLPIPQDFTQLKEEGLALIQLYSDSEWTNFNPSDPGVTILDQFCYALTELGYCNDFPVDDILTNSKGKLHVKDQFYLPEEILTTSPITIADYRKYIIDGIPEVKNVVINPLTMGVYQVYLLIEPTITDEDKKSDVCKAAFFYLNKRRNIGELFLMPLSLQDVPQLINGTIEIDDKSKLNSIIAQISSSISNYIFPHVKPVGYNHLSKTDIANDNVFNGPLLQNGWIDTDALGTKKDVLYAIELSHIIESVPGVLSVSELNFNYTKAQESIGITEPGKLLTVDLNQSLINGLDIYYKGVKLVYNSQAASNSSAAKSPGQSTGLVYGEPNDVRLTLPKGKYRDINSYYSIQNTFPELFAVGPNAINANASDYQIAQSRQLKGYLTLFDQVLANQFSQLANVHRLFSFKNSISGAPSDRESFYAYKTAYEKEHLEYPVPYMVFSPTYYYQSLYQVPHVRPLLKNYDSFDFSDEVETAQVREINSWQAYRDDPYNPYIKGLMDFLEDETISLNRRDQLLDHLLARHGESPLVINTIIDGSKYAGDSLKDRVIFKSLYLQNLGLLSYFRYKAYNYQATNQISEVVEEIPYELEQQLLTGNDVDFVFDSNRIDDAEKLTEQDFINYSAIELKISLLMGLKATFKDFIANSYEARPDNSQFIDQVYWMITQRKGLMLIETVLLTQYIDIKQLADRSIFENTLILVLPQFVLQFKTPDFTDRLQLLLAQSLPIQVNYKCLYANSTDLHYLIPAFANWHNAIKYNDNVTFTYDEIAACASALTDLLTKINNSNG